MIDNIKQNIPKYNYVMSYQIIESLTQWLKNMKLITLLYFKIVIPDLIIIKFNIRDNME